MQFIFMFKVLYYNIAYQKYVIYIKFFNTYYKQLQKINSAIQEGVEIDLNTLPPITQSQ